MLKSTGMARNTGFLHYILEEVLADMPGISYKPMFSGYGLYQDGIIFAIIIQDALYCKVGEANKEVFEAAGSTPFMYKAKNRKPIAMSYWRVPEDILEDREQIYSWIASSVAVSRTKKGL